MSFRAKRGALAAAPNSEAVSEFAGEAFADRLRALIGEGSANAFARECQIGESSVRQYLAGGVPGLDKVIQIARAKNVRVEWLATGEGPRDIQPKDHISLSQERTEQERTMGGKVQPEGQGGPATGMVLLPKLNVEAAAGQGVAPTDEEIQDFVAFKAEFLRRAGINPNNAHVLKIKGNSMYPTLQDRDIVIIDASIINVLDEGLYTLVLGDVVRAKRVQPLANGGVRIISDNQAEGYRDEIIPRTERESLRIVGRIKGVIRHFAES